MTQDLWTLGHSDRPVDDLLEALRAHQIQVVADVRRYPHSRRFPAYNVDPLRKSLFSVGIRYEFLGDELGGFRTPDAQSVHVGLSGEAFRGYADHLASPMFARGEARLWALSGSARVAILCSERQPKDCHRKILADHLVLVRAARVTHILDAAERFPHALTRDARLHQGRVRYGPRTLEESGA